MKVSEVLEGNRGRYASYEIYYRPSPRSDSFDWEPLSLDGDIGFSNNIPIEDWIVHDYELLNEADYNYAIGGDPLSFEDVYGSPDAIVLVIFISHLTYRILCDENAKTVRDLRTEYIGQFHEYLVCKYKTQNRHCRNDHDYYPDYGNGYGYCNDYKDYDDEYSERPSFNDYYFDQLEVIDEPQDVLDKMWAKDSFIIDKSDAEDFFDNVKGYGWWDEESFEEHFADSDRVAILVIILY